MTTKFFNLVSKILSDLAVKQSLFTARLMYMFASFIYPVIGLIFTNSLDETKDPLGPRIVFSAVLLSIFTLSFYSALVRKHISSISLALYYSLTFHSMYLIYMNNHRPEYMVGFIIVLMAGGMLLNNLSSLLFYSIIIGIWLYIETTPTRVPPVN